MSQRTRTILLNLGILFILAAAGAFWVDTTQPLAPAGGSQAAATVLGDTQGAPPGFTGQTNPDNIQCWHSNNFGGYGFGPYRPFCRADNSVNPFYSGIFSINAVATPGTGESAYIDSTEVDAGYQIGPQVGTPEFEALGCPADYTYDGDRTCYKGGRTTPATFCYGAPGGDQGQGLANGPPRPGPPPAPTSYSFPPGYSADQGDVLDNGFGQFVGVGNVFKRAPGDPNSCYVWHFVPKHLDSALATPVGSMPSVAMGAQMTLQWSCLPSRKVDVWGCNPSGSSLAHPFGVSCKESQYTYNLYDVSPVATGASGSGAGFAGSGLTGTKTITAPSTKGIYNYTLQCGGPYNLPPIVIPVDVGNAAVPPTVTIKGNGQTGEVSADVGTTTINVVGTFAPGQGDTLTKTALNGCTTPDNSNPDANCQNALPGVSNTDPATPKSFAFKPTQPGLYYFYPAVQTKLFFNWNNYSQKLVVNAQCAAGTHWEAGAGGAGTGGDGSHYSDFGRGNQSPSGQGRCVAGAAPVCPGAHQINPPACTCDAGYTMNGSGQCVPVTCPGGQTNPPACTLCPVGMHNNSANVCVPDTCPDSNAIPPLCTTCRNPFTYKNGSCILVPLVSLSAKPARVQKGQNTALTWSATNLGAGINCSITSNPAVFSTSWDRQGNSWSGTNVPAGPIASQTTFTLACTNAAPVTISVSLLPVFQEI